VNSPTYLEDQHQLGDSLNQCPICGILFGKEIDPNRHINSCLDDFERHDSPKEKKDSITPEPVTTLATKTQNKAESSSSTALQLLPNRPTRGRYESLNDKETPSNNDQKKASSPSKRAKRKCPFYKWIQGIPFVVDAFSYGKIEKCEGYFLSHYHSDHYHGLSSSWKHGTIYCSKITANFLRQELDINKKYIVALPMDQDYALNSFVNVCLIDANHCPGSVLFLFKVFRSDGSTVRHLHTGDFRANPRMCLHPLIRQPENDILDTLYLDTTYLNGQYSFPAQEDVIKAACDLAERCVSGEQGKNKSKWLYGWLGKIDRGNSDDKMSTDSVTKKTNSKVLIIVGTYSIGKEKLFYHLAKRLNTKVYATPTKRRFITAQENKQLDSLLTDDPFKAQIHLFPMGQIQEERLSLYLKSLSPHFTSAIAFRPTGWTFKKSSPAISSLATAPLEQITSPPVDRIVVLNPQKSSIDTIKVYGVPYSEHSSFRELASFIASLDVRRIIPTVNVGNEVSRQKMGAILQRWQNEKKKKGIQLVSYPAEEHW
ncbi:hypothetical protein INT45_001861, partial [Circinella minor]